MGIEAAQLPYVFEPFRSALSPLSGLGLGLSISRSLIEAHHGAITATSAGLSKGLTISIRLPLSDGTPSSPRALPPQTCFASTLTVPAATPAPAPTTATASAAEGPSPHTPDLPRRARSDEALTAHRRGRAMTLPIGPLKVLVVEDNALCRAVFVRAVKTRLGHEVDEAITLSEALNLVRKRNYDLIISDIGLPDGTGHDLLQEVRRAGSNAEHVRAIAVTGFGRPKDVEMSMRVGFQRHLTKPVSFHALEEAIKEVMGGA